MGVKSDQFSHLIDRNSSLSVSVQVANHLTRLIADGLLMPGDKLPGETVLARRLGVSRPSLREAIGVLATRRLVEVRPRSGTYVSSVILGGVVEAVDDLISVDPAKIWELLEVRRVIDPAAAALAAERRTEADLAALEDIASSVAEFDGLSLLWGNEGMQAYSKFFTALAKATSNTLFTHLAGSVGGMLQNALRFTRSQFDARPEAAESILSQMQAILAAVQSGSPNTARHAAITHLDFVERTLREILNQPKR